MAEQKTLEERKRIYPVCCDIYQEDGKVVLDMEMPGVTKENLDIRVDHDQLIINGKKEVPGPGGEYRIREIRNGDYHHEFTIDNTIDREKIEAMLKNGVVTLTLGIKEASKPRKIKVEIKS